MGILQSFRPMLWRCATNTRTAGPATRTNGGNLSRNGAGEHSRHVAMVSPTISRRLMPDGERSQSFRKMARHSAANNAPRLSTVQRQRAEPVRCAMARRLISGLKPTGQEPNISPRPEPATNHKTGPHGPALTGLGSILLKTARLSPVSLLSRFNHDNSNTPSRTRSTPVLRRTHPTRSGVP